MSPSKRYAKKHAKASSAVAYRSMNAWSATGAKRSRPPRLSTRPWRISACQQTWWWRSKAAYTANRSPGQKSRGDVSDSFGCRHPELCRVLG